MTTAQIGDLIEGKGVYAGIYEANGVTKEAYFEPDFLRDASGFQLVLNFDEAGEELAKRNDGRRYGNGSEATMRRAIASGKYKDGDLVLAPREFLSGHDVEGNNVRSDNLVSLLRSGKKSLTRIQGTINGANGHGRWTIDGLCSISGTEQPSLRLENVYHTRLSDGRDGLCSKGHHKAGVVPLRFFSPAPLI